MRKPKTFKWDGTLLIKVTDEAGDVHAVEVEFAGFYKPASYEGAPENWEEFSGDYEFHINGEYNDEVKYLVEERIKDRWIDYVLTKGKGP